jgi:DNA mismatch endonuclease (patch repair protein)
MQLARRTKGRGKSLGRSASYSGLRPASPQTSRIASSSSRKRNTTCERKLQIELSRLGLRYRTHVGSLPGNPDIIFPPQKLAVFCDGDFWHGRMLESRIDRLGHGHNADYWVAKIRGNVERDRQRVKDLRDLGWKVLRFWETDILANPQRIAGRIRTAVTDKALRALRRTPKKRVTSRV